MKNLIRLAASGLLFVSVAALAQDVGTTTTSTIPPSAMLPDDPIGQIQGIFGFFQSGMILSGIAGILGLMSLVLNIGPLKERFGMDGPQDWVRPLLAFGAATLGGAELANLAGADLAAIVGSAVVAGLASGALQRAIQEMLD